MTTKARVKNFEDYDEGADAVLSFTNDYANTINTYKKQFDIIWKEFGTNES